jgi:uncharacterized cupredoxin-like copper-binding protein
MSRSKLSLIGLIGMVALVAACGGDPSTATVEDGGEVVIEASEYQFTPDTIEVTAGSTVTFVIRNTGQLRHEFMIGREVRVTDGAKDGFTMDFFHDLEPVVVPADAVMEDMDMDTDTTMGDMEGDEHMDHGFMVVRQPDEEASITVTIPEDAVGDWEFGCFVEDGAHYEKGMMGTLTVVEG